MRLRPGREVWILDASPGGLQLETGVRLLPGAGVDLRIIVFGVTRPVTGRVLRSRVSALVPRLLYRAAVAFDDPLEVSAVDEAASGYELPDHAGSNAASSGSPYP